MKKSTVIHLLCFFLVRQHFTGEKFKSSNTHLFIYKLLSYPAWIHPFCDVWYVSRWVRFRKQNCQSWRLVIRYLLAVNGDLPFVFHANTDRYWHDIKPVIDNLMCHNHDERNFMCVAFASSCRVPAWLGINIFKALLMMPIIELRVIIRRITDGSVTNKTCFTLPHHSCQVKLWGYFPLQNGRQNEKKITQKRHIVRKLTTQSP